MHCTSVISLIVGEGRHRRQFIHVPVLSKHNLNNAVDGWSTLHTRSPSLVSAMPMGQTKGDQRLCGETAGLAGRQRLWVGVVAQSNEAHPTPPIRPARADRQHATR